MADASRGSDGLVERLFWNRHASPGSVWTLVAAFPVLVLALYRRERPLLAVTLAFVAVNPLLFDPPEDDAAWATRVVRGEKAWLDDGVLSSPSNAALVAVTAPVPLFALRAAIRRRPLRTFVGTAATMALMFVFFQRMATLYERRVVEA